MADPNTDPVSPEESSAAEPASETEGAQPTPRAEGQPTTAETGKAEAAEAAKSDDGEPSEPVAEEAGAADEADDAAAKAKAAAAAKAKAAAAAKAKAEAAPARALPTEEDVAAWIQGEERPLVGVLFDGLQLARFDAFNTKIRAQELVPQHWQVITALHPPEDEVFETLPEVGGLRVLYKDQALARRRIGALHVAWRELRGKRPNLWQVPDLMAALRRIIQKDLDVDFYDLLTATRDLWRNMTLPMGQQQLDVLWNCLEVIRAGTKK